MGKFAAPPPPLLERQPFEIVPFPEKEMVFATIDVQLVGRNVELPETDTDVLGKYMAPVKLVLADGFPAKLAPVPVAFLSCQKMRLSVAPPEMAVELRVGVWIEAGPTRAARGT